MSAQNLLFSSLPVSNLGLYDSTTQTIQTINSDASGNINLNSNVIVGNTLQTTGGISNGSGAITTYNVTAGGSVSAYNLTATNNVQYPNMAVTGTMDVANIVNSNSFTGGTGFFHMVVLQVGQHSLICLLFQQLDQLAKYFFMMVIYIFTIQLLITMLQSIVQH